MNTEDTLRSIENICLANFFELQEIKKKLGMSACDKNHLDEYEISLPVYIQEMTDKIGYFEAHSKSFGR